MKTSRLIGVALLIVGAIAVFFGFQSTQSVMEELSEAATGRYSDETMAYLIGGAVALVIGLILTLKK